MTNLNKGIKVFFVDLDGTLLDEKIDGQHAISDANVEGIKLAQKEGKHVIISTGRYGLNVEKFMERANVPYAVTANGATVVDAKGKVYKDDKLTLQQSLLLIKFAKENKLSIKLDGDKESYGAISYIQQKFSKKFGFFPNPHYNMPMHKEYTKFVFWGKSKSKIRKLCKEIETTIPDLSVVTSSRGWTMEVTNIKSTKGLGNLYVAQELLGIKSKSAMAHLGDTLNDSTTAQYMRLIAMGDATKELKAKAHYIGANYKNGGVAKILAGQYKKIER